MEKEEDMKFLHTMIRVKDLERSEKFYKEALGFVESRRKDFPEDEFTLLYLKLEDSPFELELTITTMEEITQLVMDTVTLQFLIQISNPLEKN